MMFLSMTVSAWTTVLLSCSVSSATLVKRHNSFRQYPQLAGQDEVPIPIPPAEQEEVPMQFEGQNEVPIPVPPVGQDGVPLQPAGQDAVPIQPAEQDGVPILNKEEPQWPSLPYNSVPFWNPANKMEAASDSVDDRAPVVMFAHGCSGTTGAIYILQSLLSLTTRVADTGNGELLRNLAADTTLAELDRHLWGFERDVQPMIVAAPGLKEKIQILYERTQADHATILTKLQLDLAAANPEAMQYLFHEIHARPFIFRRRNLLDNIACRIKDFCENYVRVGHNVDMFMNSVPCSFRGRGQEGGAKSDAAFKTVWLNTSTLLESLDSVGKEVEHHRKYIQDTQGFQLAKMFDAEDLFAFQYEPGNSDVLEFSATKWAEVLQAVGQPTDYSLILDNLRSMESYPRPLSHSEIFANFEEIQTTLAGTNYEAQIRA